MFSNRLEKEKQEKKERKNTIPPKSKTVDKEFCGGFFVSKIHLYFSPSSSKIVVTVEVQLSHYLRQIIDQGWCVCQITSESPVRKFESVITMDSSAFAH